MVQADGPPQLLPGNGLQPYNSIRPIPLSVLYSYLNAVGVLLQSPLGGAARGFLKFISILKKSSPIAVDGKFSPAAFTNERFPGDDVDYLHQS
jgi:hypothetical protein